MAIDGLGRNGSGVDDTLGEMGCVSTQALNLLICSSSPIASAGWITTPRRSFVHERDFCCTINSRSAPSSMMRMLAVTATRC